MFLSKKEYKSTNPTRYSSKKAQNQSQMIFSHRPQQLPYQSLRNSQQKVLRLRGNSKTSGIKMVSKQKEQGSMQRIKHNRNFSNAQIVQNKNQSSKINSNQSSNSSLLIYKDYKQNKNENKIYSDKNKMKINISSSFLKANKQNIEMVEPELQRKKSTQKGLNLTKKSSNQASYFLEGYESHNSKPKSSRIQKPLAEKYVFLNLNEKTLKDRQGQKHKKISIDFDAFCKQNKKQIENKQTANSSTINFYSQRNSHGSCFQVEDFPVQSSKSKYLNKYAYQTSNVNKKSTAQSKKEVFQVLNSIMSSSNQASHTQAKTPKHSYHASLINVSTNQKCEIVPNTNRDTSTTHRVNNYLFEGEVKNNESQHKRNPSMLQSSSFQNRKDKNETKKQISSTNYNKIENHKVQKNTYKQTRVQAQFIKYNPNSFSYDHVVGKGGFGKVWKAQCKRTGTIYALKQMSKALIISKKSVPSVMNQQQLLKDLKNPFLVNMCQSFQTRQNLYLLMDFLSGGDLRHHLAVKKYFTQDQTKFIIICILLGLKYLHQHQIIHRDIKPQNIVLDEKGYARITDLGVARKWRQNNSCDTSGTPGYMAPQVLCRQNHSYEVDYFAVGVIAYELMLRKRPYYGRSRKQIRDQVLAKQVQIKKQQIPDNWSMQGADFINRMIQRKPSNRLGFNGMQEILNHPWIRTFPLHRLQQKRVQSPYIASEITKAQSDIQNYTSSQQTQIKQLIAQNEIMLRQRQVQSLFEGYEHY